MGGVLKSDSTQLPMTVDVVDHPHARIGPVVLNVPQHVPSIKFRLKENDINVILLTYLLTYMYDSSHQTLHSTLVCSSACLCACTRLGQSPRTRFYAS